MTGTQWASCTDPTPMLELLRQTGRLTGRKWRLFGVGCCRRIGHLLTDERSRRAVAVAERFAGGAATAGELDDAFEAAFDAGAALAQEKERDAAAFVAAGRDPLRAAAWAASGTAHPDESADGLASEAAHAAGTPGEAEAQCGILRCLFGDSPHRPRAEPSWLTLDVLALARCIYDEGRFHDLPILSDALQDAGCDDPALLGHCRSEDQHVRGCWVLDMLLGRE